MPGTLNIPNALSAFRLLVAPVLITLAWMDQERIFVVLLLTAFVTDALDGFLARRWNQVSDLGARLDSWGDLAIYITIVIAAFLLWYEQLMDQALFTMPVIACIIIVPLVSLIRFRSLTSYHTWLTKVAAVAIAAGGTVFLAWDMAWPFQVACVLAVMSALEQITISLLLNEKRSNVKSLWHVINQTDNGSGSCA
jgi:phosphatidylglycerophosphate synthase